MPADLLARLAGCKGRFGERSAVSTLRILRRVASTRIVAAEHLIRLHETLLFLRAYPASADIAHVCDALLARFGAHVALLRSAGSDLAPLEEPEVSGIAGSGMTAVFSYPIARQLATAHSESVSIDWDAYEDQSPLGRVLPHLIVMAEEDAQVEAHVPYREWVRAVARGGSEVRWLLAAMAERWPDERERADRYDSLGLPLRWEFRECSAARTLMRLPVERLFIHDGQFLTRGDVSLDAIPTMPPLPVRRVTPRMGQLVLRLARGTSAVRYRELHGFSWGDPRHVDVIDAGRGLRFFFSGVPPRHRLPLRAYHALAIWKNGVPIGYFEGLTLCERMEAGFNLYYTFREGETAYLYVQVLRAMHQLLGVTCFILDPYQLGDENVEAIEAGAFWFYRKMGFRSTDPELRLLTAREEKRLAAHPGARSTPATLRHLVRAPMIYELPGTTHGDWDGFQLRRLGLRLAAGAAWRGLPPKLVRAKSSPEESTYVRLMQADARLRARILKFGSRSDALTCRA